MKQMNPSFMRAGAAALSLGLLLGAGSVAHADKAVGDACAASLSADGKAIYSAVVGSLNANTDLRSVVTDTTKSLVMSGTISRGDARASAEAAGQCLEQARS